MARVPITRGLLQTAWTLHDEVSARDALYVVAAPGLDAELVTTDHLLVVDASCEHVNVDLKVLVSLCLFETKTFGALYLAVGRAR